jgi:hypothetical protein
MTDVPTLTDEDAANYCTWNGVSIGTAATLTNGNLDVAYSASASRLGTGATIGGSSGKWYWEVTLTASSLANSVLLIGIAKSSSANEIGTYVGIKATDYGYYGNDGTKYNNNSATAYGASFAPNDVLGFALDMDAGTCVVYKNNVSQGTLASSLTGTYFPAISDASPTNTSSATANFGQRPFAYTPPAGFKSLNTYNLPDSTIEDGSEYFNTVLWTGDGSARTITGVGFDPDFVWIKDRSTAYSHVLFDRLRGAGNYLISNGTLAELTDTNYMSAFVTDGFSVGTSAVTNGNTEAYVAWNWKANGSGVSNTDGSTTSTVSANTTAGFSIVTYTGTGSAATVGHGLGVAPGMIIVKERTSTSGWFVYTSTTGAGNYLSLSGTGASAGSTTIWNNTAPTSSVFSVGANNGSNENTQDYVAYCFAEVEGFSKFGSYTGTGSSTAGPFVYLGFRPAFVMIKRTDSTGSSWYMQDTTRNTFNALDNLLFANVSNAEGTWSGSALEGMDALSNGFKWRNGYLDSNANGGTYIYMAFAENPFKNSLAR